MRNRSTGRRGRFSLERLRRAALPIALAMICLVGLASAALGVTATERPGVTLSQSGHWVIDKTTKVAVHVHGGAGQVDARVELSPDAAADGQMVLQGETDGFVVARDRAWVFDKSSQRPGPLISFSETGRSTVGIEAPGGPYLVDRDRGNLIRLARSPVVVEAGGPLAASVATADGTIWVRRTTDDALCALRRAAVELDCGVDGARGELTVVADVVTLLDPRAGTFRPLRDGALATGSTLDAPLPDTALVADRATTTRLAVVVPGANVLRLIDSTGVPGGDPAGPPRDVGLGPGSYGAPRVSGDAIAVLDSSTGTLRTFDAAGALLDTGRVTPGTSPGDMHRGEDGRIYVEDRDGRRVHVVHSDGSIRTVDLAAARTDSTGVAVAPPEEQLSPVPPPPPGRAATPPATPDVHAAPAPVDPPAPARDTAGEVDAAGPPAPPQPTDQPVTARGTGDELAHSAQAAAPGPADPGGAAEDPAGEPPGPAPPSAPGTTESSREVTDSPTISPPADTVSPPTGEATEAPLDKPSNTMTAPAGESGAPTGLDIKHTGTWGPYNEYEEYSVKWEPPDPSGGTPLEYMVRITSRVSGDPPLTYTTTDLVTQISDYRCYSPYTVEVRAVTQMQGSNERIVGPPVTRSTETFDCTMQISITAAAATGPNTLSVTLSEPNVSVPSWTNCRLLVNESVKWKGGCGVWHPRTDPIDIFDLEPSTKYAVRLEIDNEFRPKSYSDPVVVTTHAR